MLLRELTNQTQVHNNVVNGRWGKAKNPPCKHTIVVYSTAMAGIPSQISYSGYPKSATPFHHGVAITAN
jgi:hypothetical protein